MKLGVLKMVQIRPNPWTIVHGFGSILARFVTFQNLSILTSNVRKTSSIRPESDSKGTVNKIQHEIGCFENGANSTKSMDYSPWFWVDFCPFFTFPKFFNFDLKCA